MFSKLEEFVYRNYGTKVLSQNEIGRILTKATEIGLISTPNMQIYEPITPSDLLKAVRRMQENEESTTNKSVLESQLNHGNKSPNLVKLERVLNSFLKYEKRRLRGKTHRIQATIFLTILLAMLAFGLYTSYTPEPY